jgi:hypothetical protein
VPAITKKSIFSRTGKVGNMRRVPGGTSNVQFLDLGSTNKGVSFFFFSFYLIGTYLFFIHLFICAYIVWAISSPCPLPLPPYTPSLPGRTCSALFSNFVEEKT